MNLNKSGERICSESYFISIDIVIIKVNSQKVIEWVTSIDFNNDLDLSSGTMDYEPYLYLSISSGAFNIYY